MVLQFISDLHGVNIPLNNNADYIMLLGDIHGRFFWEIKDFIIAHPEKQDRIFGLTGNHDLDNLEDYYPWVHWMHSEEIISLDGIKFGFLSWTDNPKKVIFTEHPDIICSHAPVLDFISEAGDTHKGVLPYRQYFEEYEPQLWVHGHIHRNIELAYRKSKIMSVYHSKIYVI